MMRRNAKIVVAGVLAAGVAAGHTAAWFYAIRYLESGFALWSTQRRAAGWEVTSGPPVRGGWPLAATLSIPDLVIGAGPRDTPGHVTFHSERTVLALTLQHPALLEIDLHGRQTVQLSPAPVTAFNADKIHVEAPLRRPAGATAGTLEVRNLRGDGVTIGLLTGQLTPGDRPALSLAAEAIDLPAGDNWPFGQHISSASIDATLRGGLPRPGPMTASVAAWQQANGALQVTHFALGWGPLGVSASAQLELDGRLQPTGTADLHLIGYAAALHELSARHFITKDASFAATAVLALLARQPADGGAPEVEVPVTLRDGIVSLGQVPLARVPEVHWPER
jgi:hypothetical protein